MKSHVKAPFNAAHVLQVKLGGSMFKVIGQWTSQAFGKLSTSADSAIRLSFSDQIITDQVHLLHPEDIDHVKILFSSTRLYQPIEFNFRMINSSLEIHLLRGSGLLEPNEESEGDLLKATIDSSAEMIQVFKAVRNKQGEIVDFIWILNNHASEKIFGDVIGKSLLENNPGVVEVGIFDTFKKVVETGSPDRSERHYVHEQFNGWFLQSTVKLHDGVATTTTDISHLKGIEHQLEKSKEQLRATLDSSPYIVQAFEAVRKNGTIIDFRWVLNNKHAIKQNGDVIGKSLLAQNPGVVDSGLFNQFVGVTDSGEPVDQEIFYHYEQFNAWYRQTLVKMGDGFVMNTEDITEKKKAEQEILQLKDEIAQRAEDKYRNLFNSMQEGFCLIEIMHNEHGKPWNFRYVEVNPAFKNHTGVEVEYNKTVRDYAANVSQEFIDMYAEVARTGTPLELTYFAETRQRWFHLNAARFGSPEMNQVAILFNDVTERRVREAQNDFILKLSDALRPISDPVEVKRVAINLLGDHLKVDRALYSEINLEQDYFEISDNYTCGSVQHITGRFPYSAFGPPGEKGRKGEILTINDVAAEEYADDVKRTFFSIDVHAVVAVPLIKNGRLVANLSVHQAKPRHWLDSEIALISETAERTWAAVERVKAEEALRQSEEKYRTIFQTIDEGFTIQELLMDEKGNVTDLIYQEVNEAYARHLKVPDALGKKASELYPGIEQYWFDSLAQVQKTGTPLRVEGYNGDLNKWISAHYARIGGPDSRLISAVFNDITERKQQEQNQAFLLKMSDALRVELSADGVANEAIRMLFEHLALDRCYIAVYRPTDGEADVTHQIGNDRIRPVPNRIRLSDFPNALQIAMDRTLVIDDIDQLGDLTELDKQNIHALGMYALVAAGLRKGEQNPIWTIVAVSASPRHWTKPEIQLIEQVTERTWAAMERARAGESLRANDEKLRELNARLIETDKAKTAFFNNVSHEFRTPLTLLIGPIEELIKSGGSKLTSDDMQKLQFAYRSAARLQKLVTTLLDFARIEAGKLEAYYQPVDFSKVTIELASNFRSAIEKAGLKYVIKSEQISESIYLNREMWEKIVFNLLSNAFKFTQKGKIEVIIREKKKNAELRVKDTGSGIAAKDMERIFERFTRIEGTPARTHEGTGIGLALVRELVTAHGGFIKVKSTPKLGTEFIVSIPKGKAHFAKHQIFENHERQAGQDLKESYAEEMLGWLPEDVKNSRKKLRQYHKEHITRVIVVEDNADMREYLSTILSEDDHKTIGMEDGQKVITFLENGGEADLILSDVMMPVMDGFELVKRLKANPKFASIPVVLLTAKATEESKIEGLRLGADAYLTKPFSSKELRAIVQSTLARLSKSKVNS